MKRIFIVIALIGVGFVSVNAANEDENVLSLENRTISSSKLYKGTASISKMNGKPMSGDYDASFTIDKTTGDVEGEFSIEGAHDLFLTGNLYTGATGYISTSYGNYDFIAEFSNVNLEGDGVTFTCTARIPVLGNAESIFTFTYPKK